MRIDRRSRSWVSKVRTRRPNYVPAYIDFSNVPYFDVIRIYKGIRQSGYTPMDAREMIWTIIFTSLIKTPEYKAGYHGNSTRNPSSI